MLKQGMGMLTTHKFPAFTLDPAFGNRKFQRNENQWSMAKTIKGKSGINESLFSLRCSLPSISGREKFLVGFTPKIFPLPCDKNETMGMGLRPKERGVARASPGKRKEHPTSGESGSAKKGGNRKIYGSDSEPTMDENYKSNLYSVGNPQGKWRDQEKDGVPYPAPRKSRADRLMEGAGENWGVTVELDVTEESYVLKMKRELITEKEIIRNAAFLLAQAKLLGAIAEKLLENYQQSVHDGFTGDSDY